MEEFENELVATALLTAGLNYITRFKNLLFEIYQNYLLLIRDGIKVLKNENKIRDELVDNYLVKNIVNYKFKKEENNNLGRVDIFVQDKLVEENPNFIIECKLLDSKKGIESLNAKYVKNGICRFITEYYSEEKTDYSNAMIGFIVEKMDIENNIKTINNLSKTILNNLVEISQEIKLDIDNIFLSKYNTYNQKEFLVYHLMMDFSKNIK